jgi:hypothetical protein
MPLPTVLLSPGAPALAGQPRHPGHFMPAPVPAIYKSAVRTMAATSFAAAALLAAGASHAQAPAPSGAVLPAATSTPAAPTAPRQLSSTEVNSAFYRADENHDARLTRSEAERFPEVARRFEQIDTNRDTFISREEFTKAVMGSS